ncbi:TPR domain protein, putative component of TonB system [hydrothermal vent metagenome]|uniref:TPR domain protein, putative component of TonB system n=1 Tax=hydrothermal vent metagenome TaxID=652676 RepID=A0A3B1AVM2_9ZZZZ
MLTACGSSKQAATLDSLEDKEVVFTEIEPSKRKMNRKKVIDTYENVIAGKYGTNEKIYQDSLRRLADLKLEAGVTKNSSQNPRVQSQSKVDLISAIRQYNTYLEKYPDKESNNEIYYQLAKAYELLGELENALDTLNILIEKYPNDPRWQEINFRRGETMFILRDYSNAEQAYKKIVESNRDSIYYQRSLYKYSWSLFKQNKHKETLSAFFKLLDEKILGTTTVTNVKTTKAQKKITKVPLKSKSEQELIKDTMRAVSLTFTYLDGPKSVSSYFKNNGKRIYEPQIYISLGDLYNEKNRIIDSANTYLEFITHNQQHDLAPDFHNRAILAYSSGGFSSLILPTKETFVENYGVNSTFWNSHPNAQVSLQPQLKKHISDLSSHFYSVAKKSRKLADFNKAAHWYREYIRSFPDDKKTALNNFLLAEVLFDSTQYQIASVEYEKTAYQYPTHRKSSTAAYAAILSYEKLIPTLPTSEKSLWIQKSIDSALRFSAKYPRNKNIPAVLIKTTEKLFTLKDYTRAATTAETLLKRPGKKSQQVLKSAWTIMAHAKFELGSYKAGNYREAEIAYRKSIKYYDKKDKKRPEILKRLTASIYKQGEELRKSGDHEKAALQFLRVRKSVPNSKIVATAEYDAAAEYITLGLWKKAGVILERFRKTQSKKHKLQFGVTEKLALVYTESGQHVKAAGELEVLALNTKDKTESQRILWQVALIYKKAKLPKRTIRAYTQFIKLFPSKQPESMEARLELVNIYKKNKNRKKQWFWLKDIISSDKRYPNARTEESKNIVAQALLTMAEPKHVAYNKVKLTMPLKKSLRKKKKLMKKAIAAYTVAINYQVATVTTSATYRIAEIYRDFATSLLKSQRPKKLNEEQLEEYELLLEEQAFPLEEKAIEIHSSNLSRIKEGIYNKWVKSSLKQLSLLLPARYAKPELIEQYTNAVH